MSYNPAINEVYWGYWPLILTFDPSTSFPGHPSTSMFEKPFPPCSTRSWDPWDPGHPLPVLQDPCATVDEIAALGLRHVGYAVPIELFEPFVEGGLGRLVDLWR